MKTIKRVKINPAVLGAAQVAELEALCAALLGVAGIIDLSAAERGMAEIVIANARPADMAAARGMVAAYQSPSPKGGVL